MTGRLVVLLAAVTASAPIGSELSPGTRLYYASGGVTQEPWIYEVVEEVDRPGFTRCVRVVQQDRAPLESCMRGDSLFESTGGEFQLARPIGEGMTLEVKTATRRVEFVTGAFASRDVDGVGEVEFVPTTVTTRTLDGVVTRRLREEYSPGYLTALSGIFEAPDSLGGWSLVQQFELAEVRRQ